MKLDIYDYFAFLVLGIITTALASLVVFLGSLPGRIAKRRKHPQSKAVNAAAWISFLTLGALWPIAFVWAFLETKPNAQNESENKRP